MTGTPSSLISRDDVGAESVRVGARRARLVDAGVDRSAEMLQERAEQAAIERGARSGLQDHRARRAASDLRVSDAAQPRPGGEQRA